MVEYRHLGKPAKRKDAEELITGTAQFLDDLMIPGLLHGKVLRSPHAHADIVSIDVSKAEALKGVRTVLTYKNAPKYMTGLPAHRLLLDKKVRCVGDAVAMVAADTEEIAVAALELIEVDYNVLPSVFNMDDALKPGAPQLYEQFEDNIFPPGCPAFEHDNPPFFEVKQGDVEKGFKESAVIAEGTIAYDKSPCPLAPEPPAVICRWESEEEMTLWATTQHPGLMKVGAQGILGARVNAIIPNVGGSYGNKGSLGYTIMVGAALAKAADKPVKFKLSKTEQLIAYDQRMGTKMTVKVGLTEDGMLNAAQGECRIDTGISSDLAQGEIAEGLGQITLVFPRTANWDLTTKLLATNHIQAGIVKGFGGQELRSVFMPVVAKAMRKLGIDPVECLAKNLLKPGDKFYWRDGLKHENHVMDHSAAFKAGAEKFGWAKKWKGWGKPISVNGNKARGIGVSIAFSGETGCDDSHAYVRLEYDGTVTVHCAVPEAGMAQRLGGIKMAAEALNVSLEKTTMVPCETLNNPTDFGLAGARGTLTTGTAISLAAFDAKKQLLERGAAILGLKPEEVDTKDGVVFNKANPEQVIPWVAIINPFDSITGIGVHKETFNNPNFYATFVEVEVDLDTGKADVVKTLGASDVGQIIDPVQLKMQFHGGIGSAGTDSAHLEEHILDPSTGRMLTHNLIDYKWRPFNQFTEFDTVILESQYDIAPFKAVGVGELTGGAGPSAVMMAINNAIGVDIDEYPATPDVILKALGRA